MAQRLDARDASFPSAFAALLSAKREVSEDVDQAVRAIIEEQSDTFIDYAYKYMGILGPTHFVSFGLGW